MNCENYLNLIDDLVENELDAQTAEEVNLHIFACPDCTFQYKTLKDEKQIYNQYLFDIEPSNDLWKSLQQNITSESNNNLIAQKSFSSVSIWKENIFSFFRLNTAFAVIALLIVFVIGFGILKFVNNKPIEKAESSVKTDIEIIKSNSLPEEINSLPVKDISGEKLITKKNVKANIVKISLSDRRVKTIAAKAEVSKKQSLPKRVDENFQPNLQPNEEQILSATQAKILEKETAKQVEKIELLLRSFRNARVIEGSDTFDISYEKQQARKLLDKNVELRQIAESYRNFETEDILDKAESFLLDIANLENNPSQEKIIHIKERVKNQNIIASLQVY